MASSSPRGGAFGTAFAFLCLAVATSAPAGDWTQWRGPHFNGSADETLLPERFSRTENFAWSARMPGSSGATPIVLGDRVFVSSSVKNSNDLVGMCLAAKDGKVLWHKKLGRGARVPRSDLACPSPVTDGKHVAFTYGSGEIVGLTLDGRELWRRDLTKEFGCLAIMFGFSSTPLLYEGRLILPVQRREKPYRYNMGADLPHDGPLDCFLLAMEPATGKTIFRHVRQTDAVDESREAYVSPMPCEHGGRKEFVLNGGTYVTGHDPETGRELWRWKYDIPSRPTQQRVIPSVVVGDGLIYAPQARGNATIALKAGAAGRAGRELQAWRLDEPSCDASTQLIYRGRLYTLDGDDKVMACVEPATGKVFWQAKLGGQGPWRASPTGADGRIYLLCESGEALVIAAGDAWKELHRFSFGSSLPSRSTIVAAAGSLFVRTADELICLRKAAPEAK